MARIDSAAPSSAFPSIDTPVDNAQPAKATPQVETPSATADGEAAADPAKFSASVSPAKAPLTDPIDKSVTLLRFSQATRGGETSKTGSAGSSSPSSKTPFLGKSDLLGMRLGTNYYGEEVRVTREVGSPQGYANKFEAIAAARFGKAEPAAVVQTMDGKWHAVETTANFYGGITAADNPTQAMQGLASSTKIEEVRQKYISLLKQVNESSGADRDELVDELIHTQTQLASLLFGVPESEINFDPKHLVPGKINLVPPGELPGGATGLTKTLPGPADDFGHKGIVLELDINKLKDPAGAMGTLFHEATHLQDLELAQTWVQKYEQTGHKFVQANTGDFEDWLKIQVGKGALTKADKEIVVNEVKGGLSIPEARAHVHAALAALTGGSPEVATRELVNYVVDIKNGEYKNLFDDGKVSNGPATRDALTREIQAAYRQMPADMQRQLEAAIAAAKKENPDAWVSKITLSK